VKTAWSHGLRSVVLAVWLWQTDPDGRTDTLHVAKSRSSLGERDNKATTLAISVVDITGHRIINVGQRWEAAINVMHHWQAVFVLTSTRLGKTAIFAGSRIAISRNICLTHYALSTGMKLPQVRLFSRLKSMICRGDKRPASVFQPSVDITRNECHSWACVLVRSSVDPT